VVLVISKKIKPKKMKTYLHIFIGLICLAGFMTCTPTKITHKMPCDVVFIYEDTNDRAWGEVLRLRRTYLTKNVFIDSMIYPYLPPNSVGIDTFKVENNEWFYLYMGTYYLLFSEKKFKKGEVTKHFFYKDTKPAVYGTAVYQPNRFFNKYTPSHVIIKHPYLGECYVFDVDDNGGAGSASSGSVFFSFKYGLVGFDSRIVTKIITKDCQ
jgi:hypothetical protein